MLALLTIDEVDAVTDVESLLNERTHDDLELLASESQQRQRARVKDFLIDPAYYLTMD